MRNAQKNLIGKHEGERPRGRTTRTWESSNKMYLREIAWEVANWIHLAQDMGQWRALVNTVINLVP
jgi:hypothetical protein